MTAEEAEAFRRSVAERAAQRRQAFARNTWAIFEKDTFEYHATLDYSSLRFIQMERMKETAGMCCSGRKVAVLLLEEPVEPLKQLFFFYETEESLQFLTCIRKHNTCFLMTSFGADKVVTVPGFSYTFTIQGQVYHIIGSLLPMSNMFISWAVRKQKLKYACRERNGTKNTPLHSNNHLISEFKTALENMSGESCTVVIHQDHVLRGQHERNYNLPTTNEIAVRDCGH
ncbi:hypothetical protein PR048_010948 [Dryococelus australis]|uniref:Uncharacterized protein n=1 Tax=Dryococelus australis TaxID=614101 RepID=A0ABQ9HKI8_9NEOP|nr:hypothetical protein PR048_010948 [Dryococelus australis]